MIDYQNEIEAQTTYYNFSQGLAADGQLNQDFFQDDKDTT